MKKILFSLIALTTLLTVKAQQDAMFTHYMYNTLAVNPGYAGSRDALTLTALHRSQWVNFPGAPVTQTFTIHGPVMTDKLGLGLSVVNDKLGPIRATNVYGDVAYRLRLNKKSILAFGLKAGVNYFRGNFSGILLDDESDNVFSGDEASKAKFNCGFGMYYHRENFYVGLSTPTILETTYETVSGTGVETSFLDQKRHYFLIVGGVIEMTQHMKFKPTSFVKSTAGAPIEADITGSFIYMDRVNLGLMYRTGDAAGVLVGVNLNEQLNIGYSFDWSFRNSTAKYNAGSHEVMLRYDFIYKHRKKIKSPRYF